MIQQQEALRPADTIKLRTNEDGTLDEVIGEGFVHIEQQDSGHWWLRIDGKGGSVVVNFHSSEPIKAFAERDASALESEGLGRSPERDLVERLRTRGNDLRCHPVANGTIDATEEAGELLIEAAAALDCGAGVGVTTPVAYDEIEQLRAHIDKLRALFVTAHDRLLRGDSDAELLAMLGSGWGSPPANVGGRQ